MIRFSGLQLRIGVWEACPLRSFTRAAAESASKFGGTYQNSILPGYAWLTVLFLGIGPLLIVLWFGRRVSWLWAANVYPSQRKVVDMIFDITQDSDGRDATD